MKKDELLDSILENLENSSEEASETKVYSGSEYPEQDISQQESERINSLENTLADTKVESELTNETNNLENAFSEFDEINFVFDSRCTKLNNVQGFFFAMKTEDIDPSKVNIYCRVPLNQLDKSKKQEDGFITCCFIVCGIMKTTYVFNKNNQNISNLCEIESELKDCLRKLKVSNYKIKPVFRNIMNESRSVESDGDKKSFNCLKITYPFKYKDLGELIDQGRIKLRFVEKVVDIKNPSSDVLLFKKRIFGPSWLYFKEVIIKTEKNKIPYLIVPSYKFVQKNNSDLKKTMPSFNILLLSMKFRGNEIVMANISSFKNFYFDGKIDVFNKAFNLSTLTFLHIPSLEKNKEIEEGLNIYSRKQGLTLKLFNNEKSFLSSLVTFINKSNPDIIIGHDIFNDSLGKLANLSRLGKIPNQFLFSRNFYKKSVKKSRKKEENVFGVIKKENILHLFEGRVLVDSFLMSKEFSNLKEYSLNEIKVSVLEKCENIPKEKYLINSFKPFLELSGDNIFFHIEEMASQKGLNRTNSNLYEQILDFISMIKNLQTENFLIFKFAQQNKFINLTIELSKLCGCPWEKTLLLKRAERNDYLLSHEFYRLKYVLPQKGHLKRNKKEGELEVMENEALKNKRKKNSFEGGLVLDPKIGFYNNFVVLLDFNSLYPSIILEYNLCFTTLEDYMLQFNSSEDNSNSFLRNEINIDEAIKESTRKKKGVLPFILEKLLEQRKAVKKLINECEDLTQVWQLDVQQKAIKLAANSVYGCLGFKHSLFYCKALPALITSLGRKALMEASRIVSNLNPEYSADVIYGDTDSLMITTTLTNINEVLQFSAQVKKEVNKLYKKIYLDLDAVFRKLLLIKKKKYAALSLNLKDKSYKLEFKGLDLVRRDQCLLVKRVTSTIISIILSPPNNKNNSESDYDKFLISIIDYLEKEKSYLDSDKLDLKDFVLTKFLTKDLLAYQDKESQPHVVVATRLNEKGARFTSGKPVFYLICKTDQESSLAKKAFSPDEMKEQMLEIDREYYIKCLLFPAIKRILGCFFEGILEMIAKIFDYKNATIAMRSEDYNYQETINIHEDLKENGPTISLPAFFGNAEDLVINCPLCHLKQPLKNICSIYTDTDPLEIGLLGDQADSVEKIFLRLNEFLKCQNSDCDGFIDTQNNEKTIRDQVCLIFQQFMNSIQEKLNLYYSQSFFCSHKGCDFKTHDLFAKNIDRLRDHNCFDYLEQKITEEQMFKFVYKYRFIFDLDLLFAEKNINKILYNEIFKKNANLVNIYHFLMKCFDKLLGCFAPYSLMR